MRRPPRFIALAAVGLVAATTTSGADPSATLVSTRVLEPSTVVVALPPKAGVLVAKQERTLAFDVLGRIKQIAEEGTRVVAGDIVAELESALEQAHLRQAELRLDDAHSQLRRTTSLERSGVANERTLEDAQIAVALLRAARDAARESLAKRKLKAPLSGFLVETFAETGEIASPGQRIARLMDLETLRVSVGVPSSQVGQVRTGSRASIRVETLGSERFDGVVSRVAIATAEGEHLFEIEVEVSNSTGRLRPGMVARADLEVETLTGQLSVPVEAIVVREGEQIVFFVDDGVAHSVPVAKSRAHRDVILFPGTVTFRELVVRGQRNLVDGTRVRVDNSILVRRAPSR